MQHEKECKGTLRRVWLGLQPFLSTLLLQVLIQILYNPMTLVLPYIVSTGTSFDREIRMTYHSIQPLTDLSYTDIPELDLFIFSF